MRPGRTTRIVAAVVVTTVAGILLAATFFRRRRRKPFPRKRHQNGGVPTKRPEPPERTIPVPVRPSVREENQTSTVASVHSESTAANSLPLLPRASHSRTLSTESVSHLADEHIHTSNTEQEQVDGPGLSSPQEMIHLGAASIDSALRYWEEALETSGAPVAERKSGENGTQYETLHDLLKKIKELCAEYIELSSKLPLSSASADREDARSEVSSSDSFHSADDDEEIALLETGPSVKGDELYQAALVLVKHNQIHCRTIRTKMLCCESREDFLAKVHCVRQAVKLLMSDETMRDWFANMGSQLIADILMIAGYATEDFYSTFEKMMKFVKNEDNLPVIEKDLKHRKVKDFGFYDVVLDFLILDAFDDLESPPASVVSIIQNRWLSQSVKETGLSAAIWSVLSAKKQMLKNPHGFMGHCYDISKHVTPALAWGFMGTDEELKGLMEALKDQVLLFSRSMFSLEKCRYSSIPELADDIFLLAREMFENLNQSLLSFSR